MAEIIASIGTRVLPQVFRLSSIAREVASKGFHLTAHVFHSDACFTVEWNANYVDTRLVPGVLVRIIWKQAPRPDQGAVAVGRAVVLERPERSQNLFCTVPSDWVCDSTLLQRAQVLWEGLSSPLQELFNVIFWDGDRFHRYCQSPSSMSGHHSSVSGNLAHSVEMAETALNLAQLAEGVHVEVLVLGALLHDAGKSDEYRLSSRGHWEMTDRGKLLGHKVTIIEWVAVARTRMRQGIPESHYLSLMHAMTACNNAPAWTGLRQAMTPESNLLSLVDRASGQSELMSRHKSLEDGWGRYHPHLRSRPFHVGERDREVSARIGEFITKLTEAAASGGLETRNRRKLMF